jgi:hypothetical protein
VGFDQLGESLVKSIHHEAVCGEGLRPMARREVQGVGVGFFQVEDGVAHRLLESSHVEGVPKLV